ncbi:MAG TPA: hypothetical protein DCS93_15340 [Microscillaceae bacterium]|nr:hypothetical protein [Microscillaceae bacterium]
MSQLAQRLIAECKRTKSTFLDLGNCDLNEWPEELFDCVWLEELNFGEWFWPKNGKTYIRTGNKSKKNLFRYIPNGLRELSSLRSLHLGEHTINWPESYVGVFESITTLEILDLSNSLIKDISFLAPLTNLKRLDLGTNFIDDIGELVSLTKLQYLNVSGNKISKIDSIFSFNDIIFLDLSHNQVSDISFLAPLKNLKVLRLNRNQVRDIRILSKLTDLQDLYLSYNQINDYSFLSSLKGLQSLYLSSNQINDIDFLSDLIGLRRLDLSYNEIGDIHTLNSLKYLQSLDLSSNQISDISVLSALTNLQSLYLSLNQINDISVLSFLKRLQSLDLSSNQIKDISSFPPLKDLQSLYLKSNQIKDLTPLNYLVQRGVIVNLDEYGGKGISIHGNPVETPPIEIIKDGHEALLSYFQQLKKQEKVSIYEAKMLIVGEPGAGKTTLLNKLLDEDYEVPNKNEKSTIGITVEEGWAFPYVNNQEVNFKANLWDFGGQEIQYMLHQFFLTPRSLYVLLADDRKQNTNFPYWFHIIQMLGKGEDQTQSPVLVVLNENNHVSITNFDLFLYRRQYKELNIKLQEVDFSENDERFFSLINQIQQMLSDLPHIGKAQLPANWVEIRKELQNREESYISFDQYAEICKRHQITKQVDQLVLSRFLHDLGVVLHFQQDAGDLRNLIILKPEWAVDAIYSILTNTEVVKNKGRFIQHFVFKIWESQGYGFLEQGYLLALMKKDVFEICFPTRKSGEFITPLLLPNQEAQYPWGHYYALRFRYQYAFMPPGILTRLIVRQSEYIITHQGEEMVWKEGVYLRKNGCQIQIVERETREEGSKVIDISVIGGDNHDRKYVLSSIRNEINDIHRKSFPNLKSLEKVPCICGECAYRVKEGKEPYYHDFDVLLNFQRKGKMQRSCDRSTDDVYIHALLEGVYNNEEWQRKEVSRMIH